MVKLRGAPEGGGRRVVRERCLGGDDGASMPPPPLRLLSVGVFGIVMCKVEDGMSVVYEMSSERKARGRVDSMQGYELPGS